MSSGLENSSVRNPIYLIDCSCFSSSNNSASSDADISVKFGSYCAITSSRSLRILWSFSGWLILNLLLSSATRLSFSISIRPMLPSSNSKSRTSVKSSVAISVGSSIRSSFSASTISDMSSGSTHSAYSADSHIRLYLIFTGVLSKAHIAEDLVSVFVSFAFSLWFTVLSDFVSVTDFSCSPPLSAEQAPIDNDRANTNTVNANFLTALPARNPPWQYTNMDLWGNASISLSFKRMLG